MKTCEPNLQDIERFSLLVTWNIIDERTLRRAGIAAGVRCVSIEKILRYDLNIPRRRLLDALAEYHHCDWIEYDERTPVPTDLLTGLDADALCENFWFPVFRDSDTVIIAANDPNDPFVIDQSKRIVRAETYEFRVALAEDVHFFIQDFLNGPPEHLIGNERTGLAFWRNIMSRWRTRLACYRTDFAIARTHFGSLRWGLGLITTGQMLLHLKTSHLWIISSWVIIATGLALLIAGGASYFKIKKSIVRPPAPQTLIEVSAATLFFLENYQFAEKPQTSPPRRQTMLARLSQLLPDSCVFIENSTDNKVRSYLAHERTSLAAQRTVLACYRTIYARARTGLSFIRTGTTFVGIGIGLVQYFKFSLTAMLDYFIILAGILMIADGMVWYWPVRKEQREAPELIGAFTNGETQ
jgi:uncharacterized membrane protein YidH (DUF202 family)